MKNRLLLVAFIFVRILQGKAQYDDGTRGLLNMPVADMQRDKNFMFGNAYLEDYTNSARWVYMTYGIM